MAFKPIVTYKKGSLITPVEKTGAFLIPINHPNNVRGQHVSNESLVHTSPVVHHDISTGVVETQNTYYVPED